MLKVELPLDRQSEAAAGFVKCRLDRIVEGENSKGCGAQRDGAYHQPNHKLVCSPHACVSGGGCIDATAAYDPCSSRSEGFRRNTTNLRCVTLAAGPQESTAHRK